MVSNLKGFQSSKNFTQFYFTSTILSLTRTLKMADYTYIIHLVIFTLHFGFKFITHLRHKEDKQRRENVNIQKTIHLSIVCWYLYGFIWIRDVSEYLGFSCPGEIHIGESFVWAFTSVSFFWLHGVFIDMQLTFFSH